MNHHASGSRSGQSPPLPPVKQGSAHIRCKSHRTVKTIIIDIFRVAPAWTIIIRRCGFLPIFFFLRSYKRLRLNDSGRVPVVGRRVCCVRDKNERINQLGAAQKHKTHYARCKRALVKPHVQACSLTTVVKRLFFFF